MAQAIFLVQDERRVEHARVTGGGLSDVMNMPDAFGIAKAPQAWCKPNQKFGAITPRQGDYWVNCS